MPKHDSNADGPLLNADGSPIPKRATLVTRCASLSRRTKWVAVSVLAVLGAVAAGLGNLQEIQNYFAKPDSNPTRYVSRDPNSHRTPIYARTKARVDQRIEYLISQKIDPWLMMPTGKMKPITLHDGRTCHYSGVTYEGAPVLVFWEALIDPFLEDEIRNVLDSIGSECVANNIDAGVPLDEAAMLLRGMVRRVYDRMVYVRPTTSHKTNSKRESFT
jgi:hypothetical protein